LFTCHFNFRPQPQRETILLHGVRNNITYEELDPLPIAKLQGWETISTFDFNNLDEVLEAARSMNPALHEGFVVRDAEFRRLKVKSPQYVALAHLNLKGKLHINAKHMLQIVRTNEGDEFLVHFPEYSNLYQAVRIAYEQLLDALAHLSLQSNDEDDQEHSKQRRLLRLLDVLQEQGGLELSDKTDIRLALSTFDDLDLLFQSLDLSFNNDEDDRSNAKASKKKRRE